MLRVLLIGDSQGTHQLLLADLAGAGHSVRLAADWSAAALIDDRDLDMVVLELTDPGSTGTLARLTLLRAQWTVPLVVVVEEARWSCLARLPLGPGLIPCSRAGLIGLIAEVGIDASGIDARRAETTPAAGIARFAPSHLSMRSSQSTAILGAAASAPGQDEPRAVGSAVDRYRIEALVGRGSFAHVYQARHLLLDQVVALKVLKPSLTRQPLVEEHFLDEGRLASRCVHPNVVRIHDLARSSDSTYLVMEWIDGVTLGDIIATTGRLPASEIARIGAAVARALAAIHRAGVLHRDIKPANILLASGNGVRLVDFGLACAQDKIETIGRADRVVGTPLYMAPEQAYTPARIDTRADIYAFGATLYHACAGVPPFSSADTLHVFSQHRCQVPRALLTQAEDLPPRLAQLVEEMLAKDPARRPESAELVAEDLAEIHNELIENGDVATNGWSSMYLRPTDALVRRPAP